MGWCCWSMRWVLCVCVLCNCMYVLEDNRGLQRCSQSHCMISESGWWKSVWHSISTRGSVSVENGQTELVECVHCHGLYQKLSLLRHIAYTQTHTMHICMYKRIDTRHIAAKESPGPISEWTLFFRIGFYLTSVVGRSIKAMGMSSIYGEMRGTGGSTTTVESCQSCCTRVLGALWLDADCYFVSAFRFVDVVDESKSNFVAWAAPHMGGRVRKFAKNRWSIFDVGFRT